MIVLAIIYLALFGLYLVCKLGVDEDDQQQVDGLHFLRAMAHLVGVALAIVVL